MPNLSMGPPIVKSLRPVTKLPLETHLMITDPDLYLDEFAAAGSDSLLVHWEGNCNLHRTLQRIKALGKKAGVVINPATPPVVLEEILTDVDLVLVMTVNPGFGHQKFISSMLPKIARVREMIDRLQSRLRVGIGRRRRRPQRSAGRSRGSERAGGRFLGLRRPGRRGRRHGTFAGQPGVGKAGPNLGLSRVGNTGVGSL